MVDLTKIFATGRRTGLGDRALAEKHGLGFAFDSGSDKFKQAAQHLRGLGIQGIGAQRDAAQQTRFGGMFGGGSFVGGRNTRSTNRFFGPDRQSSFSAEQIARAGVGLGFGGGGAPTPPPFDAATGEGGAPGQPGNIRAAAARQDAAAEAGDAGFTQALVAGRREALLARRGKGIGLSSLGRGLGGNRRVADLLTTVPF